MTTAEALARVSHAAGAPGGIAGTTDCDQSSTKLLLPSTGPSLRDALESIVSADPKYKWEINNGVINLVYRNSNLPFLDVHLDEFEVVDVNIDVAVNQLLEAPEVKKREAEFNRGPRLFASVVNLNNLVRDQKHKFSVKAENITVREALNAIVRAHGSAVWVYLERKCDERNLYTLDIFNR